METTRCLSHAGWVLLDDAQQAHSRFSSWKNFNIKSHIYIYVKLEVLKYINNSNSNTVSMYKYKS